MSTVHSGPSDLGNVFTPSGVSFSIDNHAVCRFDFFLQRTQCHGSQLQVLTKMRSSRERARVLPWPKPAASSFSV